MFKKIMIMAAALTLSTQAFADRETRVLYMEVDHGSELMSRNTQAFQRIFDHTGNYLNHERIRLFEQDGRHDVGARTFDEAIDLAAKAKRNKLDAVVLVSVKHKRDHKGRKMKDRMVAIAKIVDARTFEVVDSVRVKSPVATLREQACHSECRKMVNRRHVREILPEFKEKLAVRLQEYRPRKNVSRKPVVQKQSPQLTLTLKGFKSREVMFIEDRIARLDSTRDLSSMRSKPGKQAYWLERRKNANNVRDDLSAVLTQLDLKARIVETERHVTLIKVNRDLAYLD